MQPNHIVRKAYTIAGLGIRSVYPKMGLSFVGSRKELPRILNARGLKGEGVEIGVLRGAFSQYLLTYWEGACLHSVDPWRPFSADVYRDQDNRPIDDQEAIYQGTVRTLSCFGKRSNVLRMTSADAAPRFTAGQLDFVYIDAQHHYEAVKEDLQLWHSKVHPGGLLAGHDYLDGSFVAGNFGVKRAVDEFAAERRLKVHVSREPDWPSWFIEL